MRLFILCAVAAAALALPVAAQEAEGKKVECPAPVKAALEKAYPGAKIVSCEEEKEDGKTEYEVGIETKDGKKLEVDLTPEGKVLATEEAIAVGAVPAAVMKAFNAKYPGAAVSKAAKQTEDGGKVSYELVFQVGKDRKEATFAEDGTFVEEE